MLNNFQKKFGPPSETKVLFGDYDNKGKHMKWKEPAATKRMRKLLRIKGYKVFLINEYKTSKLCNNCLSEVENFLIRKSHKPHNKGKDICVWGLVRCKNENCRQVITRFDKKILLPIHKKNTSVKRTNSIHNRDTNAVKNMLNIAQSLIDTGKRPDAFVRKWLHA